MKMNFKSKFFYAGGDFGINIMWQLTVFYLLFLSVVEEMEEEVGGRRSSLNSNNFNLTGMYWTRHGTDYPCFSGPGTV